MAIDSTTATSSPQPQAFTLSGNRAVRDGNDLHVFVKYNRSFEMKITLRDVRWAGDFTAASGTQADLKELISSVERAVKDHFGTSLRSTDWGAVYDPNSETSTVYRVKDAAKAFGQCKGDYSSLIKFEDGSNVELRDEDADSLTSSRAKSIDTVTDALKEAYGTLALEGGRLETTRWPTYDQAEIDRTHSKKPAGASVSTGATARAPLSPASLKKHIRAQWPTLSAFNEASTSLKPKYSASSFSALSYLDLLDSRVRRFSEDTWEAGERTREATSVAIGKLMADPDCAEGEAPVLKNWLFEIAKEALKKGNVSKENIIFYLPLWLRGAYDVDQSKFKIALRRELEKSLSK